MSKNRQEIVISFSKKFPGSLIRIFVEEAAKQLKQTCKISLIDQWMGMAINEKRTEWDTFPNFKIETTIIKMEDKEGTPLKFELNYSKVILAWNKPIFKEVALTQKVDRFGNLIKKQSEK